MVPNCDATKWRADVTTEMSRVSISAVVGRESVDSVVGGGGEGARVTVTVVIVVGGSAEKK